MSQELKLCIIWFILTFLLLSLWFSIMVRTMKTFPGDAFGLKLEFKVVGRFGFIFITLFAVTYLLDVFLDNLVFTPEAAAMVYDILFFVFIHSMFVVTILMPLRRYWDQRNLVIHSDVDLRTLISHPVGYASFKEHLQREFSIENLEFYGHVERFRVANRGLQPKMALQIMNDFIIPSAPAQVIVFYHIYIYIYIYIFIYIFILYTASILYPY